MAKSFRCTLEVRGYELDSYGHVNHGVYVSYLEHARWKMLESVGTTLATFQQMQRWPVIAGIELKYIKPCFIGDVLDIRSHISSHSRAQFEIEQEIYRGEALVLKAKVHAVIVNEKGRPSELPPEVAKLWQNQDDAGGGI